MRNHLAGAALGVLALAIPAAAEAVSIRAATFNASINRNVDGQMGADLRNIATVGGAGTLQTRREQLATAAEIIKIANPDVLLLNEFDYAYSGDPAGDLDAFANLFVNTRRSDIPNRSGATPAPTSDAAPQLYAHRFIAPTNTGVASGFDLNNNGVAVTTPGAPGYGDDALGFGNFPGQFGMAFLSKFPILTSEVRTFQNFLWKDMPGARLPDDPATAAPADWYSPEELAIFRLSSKNHWDIPVLIDGQIVHFLGSHPTPPVFDGAEDRNGTRNADEIRFWVDYLQGTGDYIYDDAGGTGGLAPGAKFVIMGDLNSDPNDGDSIKAAIRELLDSPLVDQSAPCIPTAPGGTQQAALQGGANASHTGDPARDTADFADGAPGNLRADYAIPAAAGPGFRCTGAGIFWPANTDPLFGLAGLFSPALPGGFPASDHRLVYVDLQVVPAPATLALLGLGAMALIGRRRRG